MRYKGLLAATALYLASTSLAWSTPVSVDSHAGPWDPSLNLGFFYGTGDQAAPTTVSVTPGTTLTIQYLDGLTSAFDGVSPSVDADGYVDGTFGCAPLPAGSAGAGNGGALPCFYVDPFSSPPIWLNALMGSFADDTGTLVAAPFAIGNGPLSILVPTGATVLQLGLNDDIFGDNSGSLRVDVTASRTTPVPGPIVGAGLPGLAMAVGGFLAWRRRKSALAA